MTFRKNSIMFIEHLVVGCFGVCICIALTPVDQFDILPYLSLLFISFIILAPIIHNEYITIDDEGIACTKRDKLIWKYCWHEILKFNKSSRYRVPSIEIVTEDHADSLVVYDYSQHYFQLGRIARKALMQYRGFYNDTIF